ncbi:MAG: type I-E CRISPR-associated endoribonuclease Cas2 [Acidobacteria bacterium]|nr:type I-E CRISPR-associated endoribonuclease Cas2 [Acidobacteriota bacterium]
MVVMILEKVSPSLRGELTRWLLELKTGVFVGNVSALVRDKLWHMICMKLKTGAGLMVFNAAREQGYEIRTHGPTSRTPEDFDGLILMKIPLKEKTKSKTTAKEFPAVEPLPPPESPATLEG